MEGAVQTHKRVIQMISNLIPGDIILTSFGGLLRIVLANRPGWILGHHEAPLYLLSSDRMFQMTIADYNQILNIEDELMLSTSQL